MPRSTMLSVRRLVFVFGALLVSTSALAGGETERIRAHLIGAEHEANSRDLGRWNADQRARRAELLDVLARYIERGVFPKNPDFTRPTPYFVDAAGTRCAMAELLWSTGDEALVREIATARNNAYVRELADDPRLVSWLDRNGLTVGEAARIQPTYCNQLSSGVCRSAHPVAIFEARWTGTDLVYTVERVHLAGGGVQVGDRIDLPRDGLPEEMPPSDRVLGLILGGTREAFHVDESGRVVFAPQIECATKPMITIEGMVAALQSDDCADLLEIADPLWAGSYCWNGPACRETDAGVPIDPIGVPDAGEVAKTQAPIATSCRAQAPGDYALFFVLLAGWISWARIRRSRR